MKTPVVFLVFNRPELTARVLVRIRETRPLTLLVVSDGPRFDRPDDVEKVAAVRQVIATGVDWPCEVFHDYAEVNLGCRGRVVSGLNWAFSQVAEAIILEDDCMPDPSFFAFAEEMLCRYRDDRRVFHVSGNNFTDDTFRIAHSYAFSRYGHIWGWATWRRAWQLYEWDLHSWNNPLVRRALLADLKLADEKGYWGSIFDRCAARPAEQTTWDYQWTYTCWKHRGLAVHPAVHLVQNIGQGGDATHTHQESPLFARHSARVSVPLTHPTTVAGNVRLDRAIFRAVFMRERPLREKVRLGAARWLSRIGRTPAYDEKHSIASR